MRSQVFALAVCMVNLSACTNLTGGEPCAGLFTPGTLHVAIWPSLGTLGFGGTVFVGDTLQLTAEVRPAVGAYIDVWGSGGCAIEYGDPIPATIQWSTSDAAIASVTAAGQVVGRKQGNALITARAPTHNISAGREVYVWVRAGSP